MWLPDERANQCGTGICGAADEHATRRTRQSMRGWHMRGYPTNAPGEISARKCSAVIRNEVSSAAEGKTAIPSIHARRLTPNF